MIKESLYVRGQLDWVNSKRPMCKIELETEKVFDNETVLVRNKRD